MPKGWTAKDERMKLHIEAATGNTREAFATVNKYRAAHGKTKKSKRAKH